MAIENKVGELLALKFGGAENVNLTRVQEATGLSYSTVIRWSRGDINRVDFSALDAWCTYFNCDVGDLLKHSKTKKKAKG